MHSVLATAAAHGDLAVLERALNGDYNSITSGLDSRELNVDELNEALLQAAVQGHLACVKLLLKHGADPDCEDIDGDTPLMLATSNNFTVLVAVGCMGCVAEVARFLLSNGCDVDARSERNRTALHMAVWNHRTNLVRMLLNTGCQRDVRDRYGDTPLMLCARRGYADILQTLLKAGCEINRTSNELETALHYAARHGHADCVRLLVNHEPSEKSAAPVDLDARTAWGFTPLMMAISGRSDDAALALVGAGADVAAKDRAGRSVLHHAVRHGMQSLVDWLTELGADPDVPDADGSVPIFEAVVLGHDEIVSSLVRFGCRVDGVIGRMTINSEYRWCGLLEAALCRGSLDSARLLYEAGCDFRDFATSCSTVAGSTTGRVPSVLMMQVCSREVREWMVAVGSEPRRLDAISRIAVRRALGPRLLHKLNTMNLPTAFVRYLSFINETPFS